MSHKYYKPARSRLHRSELAVPGSSPKMFEKALNSNADYVFLDLEDAVSPNDKIIARFKADGKIIFGGNTTSENVTLEILPGGTAGNYSQLVLGRTSSAPADQTTAVVKGGNAISGEYTITDVPNPNSFTVVYPFTQTTGGYVTVENLKKHEYVGAWLLEPSDKPIGKGLESWEKRWAKEKRKMQEAVEVFALYNRSTKWEGNKNIIGDFNLPQEAANFDPSVIAMTLTDSLKRDETGGLNRSGKALNTTNRMIAMVNKLFNKAPTVLDDIKFGIVNKPLSEFTNVFEAGLLQAGDYINGELLDAAANTSNMDAGTYNPETAQDTVVDAGLYINV